ncbi:MAG TPA: hypothetical protein VJO35_06140 [Terriglobales bacterium]|nr:hypothetical protein [Terriglobales bacterium]
MSHCILSRIRFRSRASFALALLSIVGICAYASPAQQVATSTSAYTVCYANPISGSKEYLSAIFDAGTFDAHAHERQTWGTGELAFQNYIYMNFETQIGAVGCTVYPSLARAQQTLQIWKNQEKAGSRIHLIDTGWVYKGPESNPQPSQAAKPGQYVICFSDPGQSPLYLSGDIHIDVPPPPIAHNDQSDNRASANALNTLKSEFLTFIQKQYGYHNSTSYPATCAGNYKIPRDVTAERDLLHNQYHQLKFIDTGWGPGMTASADLSTKPAAQPPPSPAMSAYEKAMMAQKPKSVSGAALQHSINAANPAASSAAKPSSAPSQMYAFCAGTGDPRNGGGHSTYYITKPFPAGPNTRPVALFTTYISHAHPRENIRGISCTDPQALDLQESGRLHLIDLQRKIGSVVELKWDPEM